MRFVGTLLLAFAVLWAVLAFVMVIERPEDYANTALGAAIFTLLFGIPGLFILRRAGSKRLQKNKDERMLGFINTRDRFRIQRLHFYMGQGLEQTRKDLIALHQRGVVDLVFDEETGYYQKRETWNPNAQTQVCEACGGKTHVRMDTMRSWTCSYCGTTNQT